MPRLKPNQRGKKRDTPRVMEAEVAQPAPPPKPPKYGILILNMSRRPIDYLDRCFQGRDNNMIGRIFQESGVSDHTTMFASAAIDAGVMRGEVTIALTPDEVAIFNRLEAKIAKRMSEELINRENAYAGD